MAKQLIVIAGPTAIGKTALAIGLAQHYNTEIISADSRQFYREMNIGTAKPSPGELKAVPHHFVNSHSVTDNFSVGDYEKAALKLIQNLFKTHDQLILVGGSGLFINAVLYGFDELPKADPAVRSKLNMELIEKGLLHMQQKLQLVDPSYYSEVDINNPQRLIRALEVFETSGRPFSAFRIKKHNPRPFDAIQIGLNTDREKLYQNINKRVDKMIIDGLIDEVAGLKSFRHLNPLNTVGYSEIFDYLDGKDTLDSAIDKIKRNTRRYAKRQLTWLKKSGGLKWYDPSNPDTIFKDLDDSF